MNNDELIQQLKKQIEELLARLEALEEWKRKREEQQLTYPLDPRTERIIKNI